MAMTPVYIRLTRTLPEPGTAASRFWGSPALPPGSPYPVYSDADGKYLFVVVSEGEELLSDSATMFLLNVNQYYERQEYLENMYRYDYFAYADIHELIR